MKISALIDSPTFDALQSLLDSQSDDTPVFHLVLNLLDDRLHSLMTLPLSTIESKLLPLLSTLQKLLQSFPLAAKQFNSIEYFPEILIEARNLDILCLSFEILGRAIAENQELYEKTRFHLLRVSQIAQSYFRHLNEGSLQSRVKLHELFSEDPSYERLSQSLKDYEREARDLQSFKESLCFEVTTGVPQFELYETLAKGTVKDFSVGGKEWRTCEESIIPDEEKLSESIRNKLGVQMLSPFGDAIRVRVKFARMFREESREKLMEVVLNATNMSGIKSISI